MNAEQKAMQTLLSDPAGLKAYVEAGPVIAKACEAHVAAIREKVKAAADAKNAADTGKTVKAGLWSESLAIVKIVAEATKDAKAGKWRAQLFEDVVGEFMATGEGEKPSTAKAYLSTGRGVLLKLLPRMTVEDVEAKSYGEVRKLLAPVKNPEADGIAKRIAEKVRYILKNADKFGGTEKATARLDAIHAEVEEHYNAVKTAKDAKSSGAKAARELEANRQQRPNEASATETVQHNGKPEAPSLPESTPLPELDAVMGL